MRYGNVGYVSVWSGSGLHEAWEWGQRTTVCVMGEFKFIETLKNTL